MTGGRDADTLYLHPQSLSGHVRVLGDQDGLAGGDDTIILDQLPTLTSTAPIGPAMDLVSSATPSISMAAAAEIATSSTSPVRATSFVSTSSIRAIPEMAQTSSPSTASPAWRQTAIMIRSWCARTSSRSCSRRWPADSLLPPRMKDQLRRYGQRSADQWRRRR